MNVELVNPTLVLGLVAQSDAATARTNRARMPAVVRQARARFDEKLRYRRALHELHQLDDRELDDLDLARADLSALARRQANGRAPRAQA